MTAPTAPDETTPAAEQDRGTPTGWRGPIAPLNRWSGDGRMLVLADGTEPAVRPLPLAFKAQLADAPGHDNSIVVGLITRAWVQDDMLWAEGPFDVEDVAARDWADKLGRGMAGWVSIDPSDVKIEEVLIDADGNEITEADFPDDPDAPEEDWPVVAELRERYTEWKVAGATLVSTPALEEARVSPVWEEFAPVDAQEALTAAAGVQTGAMIALIPADPGRFAVDGGDPAAEMHLTLAYLGEAIDWTPEARTALMDTLAGIEIPPVEAQAMGHAVLNPTGTEPATVYLIGDTPTLEPVRLAVRDILDSTPELPGIPENHDPFLPHITAGYGVPVDALTYTGPVTFDTLRVAFAGHAMDTPLGDRAMVAAGNFQWSWEAFHTPEASEYTSLTVTDDGRVFGHLGEWGDKMGECPAPHMPRSNAVTASASLTGEDRQRGRFAGDASTSGIGAAFQHPTSTAMPAATSSARDVGSGTNRSVNGAKRNAPARYGTTDTGQADRTQAPGHDGRSTNATGGGPEADGDTNMPNGGADASLQSMGTSPPTTSKRYSQNKTGSAQSAEHHSSSTPDQDTARPDPHTSTTATMRADYAGGSAPHAIEDSERSGTIPFSSAQHSTISNPALTASTYPACPPREWFNSPNLASPTPLTVTAEGRIFGHLASWEQCHTSYPNKCITAPRSATNYSFFRVGMVECDNGDTVPVGRITLGTGHADMGANARAAAAHYDNTGRCVADVACGEDRHGIWIAGALRPGVTEDQVRALRASPLSGDWRAIRGNMELVAALAVNVPGFPIPQAVAASAALVAAGVLDPPDWPQPSLTAIPRSPSGYSKFHRKPIDTDRGRLDAGVLTMDTSHASVDPRLGLTPEAVVRHYDHTGKFAAMVRCHDGRIGPWLSGQIAPWTDPKDAQKLACCYVSGDWRSSGGQAKDLRAVLAVNLEGFPEKSRALAASGATGDALVAAGIPADAPAHRAVEFLRARDHARPAPPRAVTEQEVRGMFRDFVAEVLQERERDQRLTRIDGSMNQHRVAAAEKRIGAVDSP